MSDSENSCDSDDTSSTLSFPDSHRFDFPSPLASPSNADFYLLGLIAYYPFELQDVLRCHGLALASDDLTNDGGFRGKAEGTRLANQVMTDALRNPKTYRTKLKVGETIRNWWERACTTASEGAQRRFVQVTQEYADAIYQQAVNRRHDEIPNIETSIQLCRDTSPVKLCLTLVEYSLNLSPPDELFDHPLSKASSKAPTTPP